MRIASDLFSLPITCWVCKVHISLVSVLTLAGGKRSHANPEMMFLDGFGSMQGVGLGKCRRLSVVRAWARG